MSGSNGEGTRIPVLRSESSLDTIRMKSLTTPIAPPTPPAEQSDWQRYLNSVLRHKWFVIIVTLLGTALGIIATRFLDPRYTAKAILWVDVAVGRDHGMSNNDPSAPQIDSRGWEELVVSNAVLDTVVKQRRLFLHPESPADSVALSTFDINEKVAPGTYRVVVDKAGRAFRLELEDGTVVQRGRVGQPVGETVGFDWTPTAAMLKPNTTVKFGVSAITDASASLAKSIKTRLDPDGNFLRLQLKSTNPAGAAATLNAITARIVAVESEMKRTKFEELASVMDEQHQHAKEALDQADQQLRDFRVRNAGRPLVTQVPGGGLTVEGGNAVTQLRTDMDQQRRDRTLILQFATRAQTGTVPVQLWTSIPSVQNDPVMKGALDELGQKQAQLRQLRLQYTDSAAPVRQLTSDLSTLEHQQIPSLARILAGTLGEVVATTKNRADTATAVLREAPGIALEGARLEREQRLAEEQFNNVDGEYQKAKLGLISALPDVRVLDPAQEPRRPAADYGPLLILLAAMASFGLAVMGVNIRDKMDPKVRYPEQITGRMQLQILGAVPHVSWRLGANGDGPAQVIEALRGLRLRVLHAHAGDGPLTLTITSPGIGDGKSFVSLNLALSFADAGYRTLLVDGDTRRGVQHKALKTPSTPGLTDVVAGRVALDAALRQTSYPGLTFLSSGTRMQRAPERLLSQNMRDLMSRLRSMFDVVIVDSPPLGAGADPLVLGTLTENLLLVLRTGQSDINLASTKLEVLNALPVRVIGAVLNDVRSSGVYRYYMYSSAEYELLDDEGQTREALPSVLGGRT